MKQSPLPNQKQDWEKRFLLFLNRKSLAIRPPLLSGVSFVEGYLYWRWLLDIGEAIGWPNA